MRRRLATSTGLLALCLGIAPAAHAVPEFFHRGTVHLDPVSLGGDNDRRPEPGETFNLLLTLNNEGDDAARNISATLSSSDARLTVSGTPPSVRFPNMAVGAWGTSLPAHFRLTASAAIPCGQPVLMVLTLSFEDSVGTPLSQVLPFLISVGEATPIEFEDFDQGPGGWDRDTASSTGTSGAWIVAGPESYLWAGELAQPGRDVTYPDVSCFYTGQNRDPVVPQNQNVDGGNQVLLSRVYDLTGRSNVFLQYHRFFYTDDPAAADSYEVQVSNDDGFSWTTIERITARANAWTPVAFPLDTVITPFTTQMRLRVRVEDAGLASVCEGAINALALTSFTCAADPLQAQLANDQPELIDDLDPACTDADGIADAGETIEFSVVVENTGNAQASNVRAAIGTLPPSLSLLSANPVSLGVLADNGGSAVATWRLLVDDATSCQTDVMLNVSVTADAPFASTPASYDETLEEDVDQPRLRYFDDFDSGLPAWSTILYGLANDWGLQRENCVNHPPSSTPALNFWYAGDTGTDTTDCSVSPYGANNDAAIRSPRIDTGFATPELRELNWNQLLTITPGEAEYAEVYIDHDDDGIFSLLARYEGLVTTNGDTLDPTSIDLPNNPEGADLSGATQFVTIEFRFISDATGGGGSPLTLGWIVDNVELVWTDAAGRICDVLSCSTCVSTPVINAIKTTICATESLELDGSASILTNCPAPGVRVYAWFRNGLPYGSATPTITLAEAVPGAYDYRLDVSCSTSPGCTASTTRRIDVIDCPGCVASANIRPAPTSECAGTPVLLDATVSTVVNCPVPGVKTYQWSREGLDIPGPVGTASTYSANETVGGSYTYAVEVACSTNGGCIDSVDHVILFEADGTPFAVANVLKARKLGANVELTWIDPQPLAVGWNLYRALAKGIPGSWLPPTVTAPAKTDAGAVSSADDYYYTVRAESCSGIEGP